MKKLTEKEKLQEICDKIGYELELERNVGYLNHQYGKGKPYNLSFVQDKNVREIIFTQEFMDKFIDYRANWNFKATPCESLIGTFYKDLLGGVDRDGNLDNPVDYLYNILQ